MIRRTLTLVAGAVLLAAALTGGGAGPAAAQNKKIVAAIPGIPPIFSVMIVYIADKQGIFKKYGIDIEIRPFDNGTAAARAVVAGDADISWSPTPPVINQISNAGVPLIAVYGMPNPDWVIGTTEVGKTCEDIKGQEVGVDSVGGARSVALRSMLRVCKGVTIEDTKQVALGGGAGAAMIAGRLQYGVLHLDDIAEIEAQGKKLNILLRQKDTDPMGHYLMLVVRKDKLAANRDAIVRATAAMIESARFINDPKNLDVVAEACMITGHSKEIAKAAVQQYIAVKFWATNDDGLPRDKLEATAALMKKIGAITADKQPVTYDNLVDTSVWKDANAMVK
jgi:ABC-type nitrate/sulfonate/bicarbonate transport system substrate-binding protein